VVAAGLRARRRSGMLETLAAVAAGVARFETVSLFVVAQWPACSCRAAAEIGPTRIGSLRSRALGPLQPLGWAARPGGSSKSRRSRSEARPSAARLGASRPRCR
jgi:hypothetical protein